MATEPNPGAPRPFDVQTIEHLIGLMGQHELTEIALQEGDLKIRLRKGGSAPVVAYAPAPAPYPAAAPAAPNSTAAAAAPAAGPKLHEIKSEMVGTFYAAPSPTARPFVAIGDEVKPGQVLCIIEAMKMMNQIESDRGGRVTAVMAKNGDPVEFGQPLFVIE